MRVKINRALLSVSDKSGLVDFASALAGFGVELWSSGGTATALDEAGLAVTPVENVTGAPEMLGGRVKTLHPKIHGGILADRSKPDHLVDLENNGVQAIDLVCVNLYPFVERPGIETIDIGGPTMVRAAAKNHAFVTVVTSPDQYASLLSEMEANDGTVGLETRRGLAYDAFAHTAAYDASIVSWFGGQEPLPVHLDLALERRDVLRYGENPHQMGARYRRRNSPDSWLDTMRQLSGKAMSYINYLDIQAAWSLVQRYDQTACVVVKHANPCGVATGDSVLNAYERAFACDSLSAFGGVVGLNRPCDVATAEAIAKVFTEVVVAPGFEDGAAEIIAANENVRVLVAEPPRQPSQTIVSLADGFLVQTPDQVVADRSEWEVVTDVAPTDQQWDDLEFAWTVVAATGSNAIVLAQDGQALGIGAGQQSRVHAAQIAAEKAGDRFDGGVCASDAFFPFRDGVDTAVAAGAKAIVQPGGSIRDPETIAAANEHGVAMVFTKRRHFKH
ncbi:MAG: bifunctional phosphoribosylaminoimidazolecarboxamide formyltransferase/IMP cyclohydrolase [Actinobacteria bacterium]|nr:bifunctional phosphoribosylaminoimidazolecarboxamide formyltransferase/IMP cyclohydrolase [Actinomycetota bacterium]MCB9390532.1 bifunctional phosphoribosylaminoimidazolecarboxamide formyltransferase/IMP cyclohydrolase [Acidimicrobiia bacterium]